MSIISSASPSSSTSGSPSFALRNITIDDNDSSLRFSQGWSRSLLSNAVGGSLQIATGVGDMVQFNLPKNAVALYYFGLGQTGGALYGVCMDCTSTESGNLETFDAHTGVQPTGTSVLFSKSNLDPTVPHSFTLVNFPDTGFGGESTITLDAFVITIQDEVVSTSSDSASFPSASLATTSISKPSMAIAPITELSHPSPTDDAPAPTATDISSTQVPASTSISTSATSSLVPTPSANRSQSNLNTTSSGAFHIGSIKSPVALGGILVALIIAFGMLLFALMSFMRRRRRRTRAPFVQIRASEVEKFMEKNGPQGGSGSGNGTMVRVAPGAMVEQLVPDRPRPGGNIGGYRPVGPPGGVGRPGAMPNRTNPARRSFVDRLVPGRVSQFVPRSAPRALFPAGSAARRQPAPVAYSSPLRNEVTDFGPGANVQDPFADADPFEEAEREAWMRQNGARAPVVAGHRPPEPAFRAPATTSAPYMRAPAPSDDPFAYAEMEARRQMPFQGGVEVDKRSSVASHYSQAGHEEPTLPTPWLQGNKVQQPWELV